MHTTRGERETILRFDEEERRLHLYTASPTMARRWKARGVVLKPTHGGGFAADVPLECLRPLRRLDAHGRVVKRKGGQAPPRRKGA